MARNRKRAKERRDRRPQTVAARSRLATTRTNPGEGLPSPLEHAAPDVELADAQLAVGRPDLAAETELEPGEDGFGAEAVSAEADDYAEEGAGGSPPPGPPGGNGPSSAGDGPPGDGGAMALPAPGAGPEPRAHPRARLLAFLEGSWRELQRVQWPDRRQVMQATAVVLGFVIIAGIYLGLAGLAASHLMTYILTGK